MRTTSSRRRRRCVMSEALMAPTIMTPQKDPFYLLFSFKGREGPAFSKQNSFEQQVNASVISFLAMLCFFVSFLAIGVIGFWAIPFLVASFVPGAWISSAYLVRRGHDLGWSAIWVLVPMITSNLLLPSVFWFAIKGMVIPAVLVGGSLFTFLMCAAGYLYSAPGTLGPNQFGPDPRETK